MAYSDKERAHVTPFEIKDLRKILRLTQQQLGEALGLSGENIRRTVRRWEKAEIPITGPARLALALLVERSGCALSPELSATVAAVIREAEEFLPPH